MRLRPRKRDTAALVLAGLLALAPLLIFSSGGAGATTDGLPNLSVQATYGCDDGTDSGDAFVEVTLTDSAADADGTVYQAGLITLGTDAEAFPDGGGPTLVTVGQQPVTVRLAGPVNNGDQVMVTSTDPSQTRPKYTSLAHSCMKNAEPTIDDLSQASLTVKSGVCDDGTVGALARVTNPNRPDADFVDATGLDQVPYTVVLLTAGSAELVGTDQLNFDRPSTASSCLSPDVATTSEKFEVRAIGVDGSVKAQSVTLNQTPPSTSPVHPPTSPPTTAPTSKPTSQPTSGHTSKPAPQPTAKATGVVPSAGSNSQAGGSQGQQPGSNGLGLLPGNNGGSDGSASPPASTHSALTQPGNRTNSSPTPSSSSAPAIANDPRFQRLADPPLDSSSRIFVWQRDAALIVLLDALAISGLVGGVVWGAKRR
ncbi:hypothetical protein ACSMXN_16540 [Jatrophihabitans sp. DSM 45814]